jgi:hypothetical protein
MILYLDANALVKRYVAEPGSAEVERPPTPTPALPRSQGREWRVLAYLRFRNCE